MKKITVHVCDGDAADIVAAEIDGRESEGYGLYKHLRGDEEVEEYVYKTAILDALKKSKAKIGDRVTVEFVVSSLRTTKKLIGYSEAILVLATENVD